MTSSLFDFTYQVLQDSYEDDIITIVVFQTKYISKFLLWVTMVVSQVELSMGEGFSESIFGSDLVIPSI